MIFVLRARRGERMRDGGGCLGGGARGVGVEALFVEEEDAGAEGEEHDGEAGGDAETGDDGSGTIVAAADNDVAGDGNQKLEDAAFQEPGEEPGHNRGRISKIEIEENSPEQPEDKAEAPDISFRGKVRVPKLIARDADAERKDSGGGENGHEKSGDCAGNENVGAGLEAFERGIDGEKKQEGLARKKDAERDPDAPLMAGLHNALPQTGGLGKRRDDGHGHGQDETKKNQGVTSRDDDAPFAHEPSFR